MAPGAALLPTTKRGPSSTSDRLSFRAEWRPGGGGPQRVLMLHTCSLHDHATGRTATARPLGPRMMCERWWPRPLPLDETQRLVASSTTLLRVIVLPLPLPLITRCACACTLRSLSISRAILYGIRLRTRGALGRHGAFSGPRLVVRRVPAARRRRRPRGCKYGGRAEREPGLDARDRSVHPGNSW